MGLRVGVVSGLIAAVTMASAAQAQGPAAGVVTPGWIEGAPLPVPRNLAATALLPNGKVLIAGGRRAFFNDLPQRTAELYDPATDTFTATGQMAVIRYNFAAALLLDGKVLVAGGAGPIATAELYDPAAGTWTNTGSMLTARSGENLTRLTNGKILATGGGTATELYDPATGIWSAAAPLAVAHNLPAAVVLNDGRVLVAGGDNTGAQSTSQIYNPVNNTWSTPATMTGGRDAPTLTLLANGKVLAAAGNGSGAGTAELFDPVAGTWTATGALAIAHGSGATAVRLVDGRVLLSGGTAFTDGAQSNEIYNPATGTWSSGGATSGTRNGHYAVLLPTGQVMLGGQFALAAPNVSLFTPATTILTEGLNFGDQTVGTTRAAAPLRITNTGNSLLLVRGLKITGDFKIATDGCSATPVLPGAVCTLGVTFSPTDTGPRAGTVTFRANTTTSPHSAAVSGTGVAPDPTPTPEPTPAAPPLPVPAATPTPAAPPLPKPQLQATLSFTFKAGRTSTKLNTLTLRNLEKGVTISVSCPKGCKQKSYTVTTTKSTVSLKLLVPKALKVGTKLTVSIRKPGALGLTKTVTIRRSKAPSVVTRLGVQ